MSNIVENIWLNCSYCSLKAKSNIKVSSFWTTFYHFIRVKTGLENKY